MTGPIAEVVVGAVDVADTVAFLAVFGFGVTGTVEIDAEEADAVYGLTGAVAATRLEAPVRPEAATILVVPTPHPGRAPAGWTTGPRALDVYTRDLDATIALAAAAGHAASPVGGLSAGPMTMRQAMFVGAGGLAVVAVESTHRRSSGLDDAHADALHSEPHSVVWVVADQAAEVAWWTARGWTAGPTIGFSEPSISDELGLAERPTPITMTMLSDEAVAPVRLELMTFDSHREPAHVEVGPIASGLYAVAVTGEPGPARLLVTPGGVRTVVRP